MEGRSSPRVKVKDISAKIRRRGFLFSHGKESVVRIVDMGPKGLSFEFDRPVDPDTRFDLVLQIPGKRTIKCTGLVKSLRRTERGYILGVKFIKLSQADRLFLGRRNILEIAEVNFLDASMELKDRLRALRTAMELTITELSEVTGVAPPRILQIEFGMEKRPPEELLHRLSTGLGITVEELLGQDELDKDEVTMAMGNSAFAR